jgi:hypothetical protein
VILADTYVANFSSREKVGLMGFVLGLGKVGADDLDWVMKASYRDSQGLGTVTRGQVEGWVWGVDKVLGEV